MLRLVFNKFYVFFGDLFVSAFFVFLVVCVLSDCLPVLELEIRVFLELVRHLSDFLLQVILFALFVLFLHL